MKENMWSLCIVLSCLILSAFSGNYTYYEGFAYKNDNQTLTNLSMDGCVCQCLFAGCSALTYYNTTRVCSLAYDRNITEDEVNLNNTARLLLISANLV